jgi:hypothetical protein
MGLDSPIRLTKMDENRNMEDRVGMHIADSNLIIQAETLQKRMDRNPKTPLEKNLRRRLSHQARDWGSCRHLLAAILPAPGCEARPIRRGH